MANARDLRGIALDGRYELGELLGEGTFGRVYRGHDRRLERDVAVKVVKPSWSEDPAWGAIFERETRMLARLNDPGIVQIHDVGRADEGLYYVSELVEGESLAQRLRAHEGGGLPPRQARAIALNLCRALGAAHARGIVHRDVKPANILLGKSGPHSPTVKVADFGVARLAQAGTEPPAAELGRARGPDVVLASSLVVGTPRYMAPEQARAEPGHPATTATDVYSAGIVLYEMLAGHTPFDGDTEAEFALGHLFEAPPPLPAAVDEDLRAIVVRALAKDPVDRFADGAQMAAALASGGRAPVRAPRRPGAGPGAPAAAATLAAPRLAPRTDVNPSARRRAIALVSLVGVILAGLALAALIGSGHHRDVATPAAAHTVEVPLLVGENVTDARARLRALHLRVLVHDVPAPGIRPGTVTGQTPVGGHTAVAHARVRLSVSEVPRWRPVATVTGRASAPFRIRGLRWRVLVSADSTRHCTLLVFCHGSSVTVLRGARGTVVLQRFGIGDGTDQPHVVAGGPGRFRVTVDPASSSTRWSLRIEDDY